MENITENRDGDIVITASGCFMPFPLQHLM